MEKKIEMSIFELECLLNEQKKVTADYITRNLTVYNWFIPGTTDLEDAKNSLKMQALKSGNPYDFEVLKKYIK